MLPGALPLRPCPLSPAACQGIAWATLRRLVPRHATEADRAQLLVECRLALWKAQQTWDPARGSFSTHLISITRNLLREQLRAQQWWKRSVRAPAPQSYDLELPDAEGSTLLDRLADRRDPFSAWEWRHLLLALPAREQDVLRRRYWVGETFGEIAAALGVGESRAFQLHGQALGRLRRLLEAR